MPAAGRPSLAFGLGGFAGGAALRQVVLATRRQGWRGFVGRTNGGMIVHLGVVIVAVAIAASGSYVHESEARYAPGQTRTVSGPRDHLPRHPRGAGAQPRGHQGAGGDRRRKVYEPALSLYGSSTRPIGTPSVKTGITEDVFVTITRLAEDGDPTGPVTLRVLIEPMTIWLWIGGGVMGFGTLLAAWPGRRRRPTDPTSAPIEVEGPPSPDAEPEPALAGAD